MVVTYHAAERYLERVDGRLTIEQAVAAILKSAPAVEVAARFGCRTVRLGNGARLVLDGERVLTVLARGQWSRDQLASVA